MTKHFTATHGVEFGEEVEGTYEVWAKFVHDPTLDSDEGVKTYVFSTEDAKTAERLRKVEDYGIAEAKAAKAEPPPAEA